MKSWYFIWDGNHTVNENELLRREGFKVFGGGRFSSRMEHDRYAAARFVQHYGMHPPPTRMFQCPQRAADFVRQHPNTSYVFKPDNGESKDTWVPQDASPKDANRLLQVHLQGMKMNGRFILQQYVHGIETNVEVWFVRGEPKFALMILENKRKLPGDLGDLTGCAFDFVFPIPLDSRIVTESVGKLYPAYKKIGYTGFGDANLILSDNNIWFLEKCERFGYNSHPNFFWNLSHDGFGQTISSLVDGTFKPNLRSGFGASVTMFTSQITSGDEIAFPRQLRENLFFWDAQHDGVFRTAGCYDTVLMAMAAGETMESAWENLMAKSAEVKFPNQTYRTDGSRSNYPNSPIQRYNALKCLNYV